MNADIQRHDNPIPAVLPPTDPIIIDRCTFCTFDYETTCPKKGIEQVTGVEWRRKGDGVKSCDTWLIKHYKAIDVILRHICCWCLIFSIGTVIQTWWIVTALLVVGMVTAHVLDESLRERKRRVEKWLTSYQTQQQTNSN